MGFPIYGALSGLGRCTPYSSPGICRLDRRKDLCGTRSPTTARTSVHQAWRNESLEARTRRQSRRTTYRSYLRGFETSPKERRRGRGLPGSWPRTLAEATPGGSKDDGGPFRVYLELRRRSSACPCAFRLGMTPLPRRAKRRPIGPVVSASPSFNLQSLRPVHVHARREALIDRPMVSSPKGYIHRQIWGWVGQPGSFPRRWSSASVFVLAESVLSQPDGLSRGDRTSFHVCVVGQAAENGTSACRTSFVWLRDWASIPGRWFVG